MPDTKSRIRVERLLRRDFRQDDLIGLFLFARDRCDGREAISDVGHFVAHHLERDRGIVTRSTREWSAVARFHAWAFREPNSPQIQLSALPPATTDYLRIAVNRLDATIIKKDTGLSKPVAFRLANQVVERLKCNADGTWAVPSDLSKSEFDLIRCLSRYMVVKPAFEASRLIEDFLSTLKSNGLITNSEIRENREYISIIIQLFAISTMHNCLIQIGDGSCVKLQTLVDTNNKNTYINASIPTHSLKKLSFASSIFTANVDPALHCHPELLEGEISCEIELSSDVRLVPFR